MEAAYAIGLSTADLHRQPYHHSSPLTPPLSCTGEGGADGVRATPRRHDDETDLGKASHVGIYPLEGRRYDWFESNRAPSAPTPPYASPDLPSELYW